MIIDTHSHLNFKAFDKDREKVIDDCLDNKIWMINVGTQHDTSKKAVEIAKNYEKGVYAAVGLHPIHLETGLVKIKEDSNEISFKSREEDFSYEKYRDLAISDKVVAIGETGLDYWYRPKTKKRLSEFKLKQKQVFLRQMDLAKELDLPLIVHCRLGLDDILEIIDNNVRGVIHCFTGNLEQARKFVQKGFYLGLNGIIFKLNLDEVIVKTPLENILVETDCPYLCPVPKKRNTPLYIKNIIERIAELKGISFKEIAEITTENARKLFRV